MTISVRVNVINAPAADANWIYIPEGEGQPLIPDFRARVWQSQSFGVWPAASTSWTAAHEAGHLMGLPDMYFDLSPTYGPVNPGMDGLHDIMAEDDGRVTIA